MSGSRDVRVWCVGVALLSGVASVQAAQVTVSPGATVALGGGTFALACADLAVQGTVLVGPALVNAAGNVAISPAATLDGGSGTINVGGNWANSGNFTRGTSTVAFVDGCTTTPAQLTGTTAFTNLTFTSTGGRTFVIPAGNAISVFGALTLAGTSGSPIQVVSANPSTPTVILLGSGATVSNTFAVLGTNVTLYNTANPPRLGNISTRGRVLTGNDVMIGGFIIGGSASKTVLIRSRGPSMIPAGVTDALADPTMTLVDQATSTILAVNDNWQSSNAAAITATGLAPTNGFESAILTSLAPGAYTVVVSGVNNGVGVGIVEVFEVDAPEVPLANISTRGQVQTGNNVMIGGFIISGTAPQQVLIRSRGPSMIPAGVTNALADPTMTLVDQATSAILATNDNWGTASNASAITATGLAPTNALESAILTTLQPGAYTVVVSGVNNGVGVGIVEVFAQ